MVDGGKHTATAKLHDKTKANGKSQVGPVKALEGITRAVLQKTYPNKDLTVWMVNHKARSAQQISIIQQSAQNSRFCPKLLAERGYAERSICQRLSQVLELL